MIVLFIESIIMIIKDIILVREQSLTFFKQILSVVSYVYGMTYKEFYGSDYDQFKKVLDSVLNTIHSSVLACIQYTTSRIKSPESVMKKIGNEYSLLHDIIGVRIICSFVDEHVFHAFILFQSSHSHHHDVCSKRQSYLFHHLYK